MSKDFRGAKSKMTHDITQPPSAFITHCRMSCHVSPFCHTIPVRYIGQTVGIDDEDSVMGHGSSGPSTSTGRKPQVHCPLWHQINNMHSETAASPPVLPSGELDETYVSFLILTYSLHYMKI